MKALVYDTETTDLPLFNEPSEDPRQPHIVQLAALLVDLDTRKTLTSIDLTIKHRDWKSGPKALEAHKITPEYANSIGVSEEHAVEIFVQLWSHADLRIAHNESFDARILRIALCRYNQAGYGCDPDAWKAGRAECTLAMSSPIMKMPPTDNMIAAGHGRKFKPPKCSEAYEYFCGRELVDAHSAFADASACRDVYFAILDRKAAA